jgi:hypothetical protein
MESHDAELRESGQGWARKPSRFHATPREIDAFLRVRFAEDTLLRYQWAIGDAAAHEVAEEIRADARKRHDRDRSDNRVFRQQGADAAADLIDTAKGAGHYPSVLVNFEKS